MRRVALVRNLLWPTLLVCGVLAPFVSVVVGARTLVAQDTERLYEPLRGLVVDALRAGKLPLWNPYEAGGVPLFAEAIHGVLHPVSVATAFVAPTAGLDATILLHLVIASGGAYVLARTLGASEPASAAAGFAYALAGYTVSMAANLVYLVGAASAPWVVAAMRHAAARPLVPTRFAALSIAVAACAFSGEPQSLAWALLLGAALAADAGGVRGLIGSCVAAALGLLVAGVQLVPSWVYLQQTNRGRPLVGMESMQWPLEPWRFVEWVVPGMFSGLLGRGDAAPFLLLGGPTLFPTPFAQSVFIGAAVLLLAAAAPGRGRRAVRILVIAAAVAVWLSLGHRLGATQLSSSLPVWGKFRYPEKLMAPFTLCVAALCAVGADRIATTGAPRWLARAALALFLAATLVGLMSWFAPAAMEHFFARAGSDLAAASLARAPPDAAMTAAKHLATGIPHAILALGASTAILWFSRRWRRAWVMTALVGLVFVPSAAAIRFATRLAVYGSREERAMVPIPARGEIGARIVVPYRNSQHTLPKVPGVDALVVGRRLGVPPLNVPARLDNLERYGAAAPIRWLTLTHALGDNRWRAYRRYGATHAVVPPPLGPEDLNLAAMASDGGRLVFEDPALGATVWSLPHRPWATFAGEAVALSSSSEALDRVLGAIAIDDSTVFVESGEPIVTAPGVVRSVQRRAERVRVEAEAAEDALLVVNDAFFAGWRATIDGRNTEILPADVLVRAVRWPAGRHVLEMIYDPAEVRWGWTVTISGGLLLAAGALAVRARAASGAETSDEAERSTA